MGTAHTACIVLSTVWQECDVGGEGSLPHVQAGWERDFQAGDPHTQWGDHPDQSCLCHHLGRSTLPRSSDHVKCGRVTQEVKSTCCAIVAVFLNEQRMQALAQGAYLRLSRLLIRHCCCSNTENELAAPAQSVCHYTFQGSISR